MTARSRKATEQLPAGLSPTQEAEWWDAHKDYWDAPDVENEVVGPLSGRRTEDFRVRLPVDLIVGLKAEASRRNMSYQTLIRMWLDERLATEVRSA